MTEPTPPRRGFLGILAGLGSAIAAAVPVGAGLGFLADPFTRKRTNGGSGDGFVRAATLAELPGDGSPQRIVLRADRRDAWNSFPNETIGAIFLRKLPDGSVQAVTDVCPHLGCKVSFQQANRCFYCPCHASSFDLDGQPKNKIPPRSLDALVTRIDSGVVYVRYQEFAAGKATQEALT